LGNIYLSNQLNLGNLSRSFGMPKPSFLRLFPSTWPKVNQSKIINYAKQTQFFKKSNVYNLNKNNELQQKIDNGHLVKTNPNKANFERLTC